jgi:hypothetical protein
MCRSLFFLLLQRLKESMPGDARDFNNMETRAVIKFYFFPAKQGAEGNSRHSDTNIKGNIWDTIMYSEHCQYRLLLNVGLRMVHEGSETCSQC